MEESIKKDNNKEQNNEIKENNKKEESTNIGNGPKFRMSNKYLVITICLLVAVGSAIFFTFGRAYKLREKLKDAAENVGTVNLDTSIYPTVDSFLERGEKPFWSWETDYFIGEVLHVDNSGTVGIKILYPSNLSDRVDLEIGVGVNCTSFTAIDLEGTPAYNSVTNDKYAIKDYLVKEDLIKAYCLSAGCARVGGKCEILKDQNSPYNAKFRIFDGEELVWF